MFECFYVFLKLQGLMENNYQGSFLNSIRKENLGIPRQTRSPLNKSLGLLSELKQGLLYTWTFLLISMSYNLM